MKTLDSIGIEPVLIDAKTAATVCGVSRSTWLGWDASGMNPRPVRIGGRVLWSVEGLRRWAAAGCPEREVFEQGKRLPDGELRFRESDLRQTLNPGSGGGGHK